MTYARAMAEKIAKGVVQHYNRAGGDLIDAINFAELSVFEILQDARKVVESDLADAFESVGAIEVEDA